MKKITLVTIISIIFLGIAGVTIVKANPSFFSPTAETATATTTLSYLTPGTATTTLSYNALNSGNIAKADSALLVFQYTASSTAPKLNARVEYSRDNVDWYPSGLSVTAATTTIQAGSFAEYQWSFSTTTTSGDFGGTGTQTRQHMSLVIPTPTQYVRVKFYVPASGGNGALWAQIIPVKERAE